MASGIYIHIPFCIRKCLYCDFNSGPATENVILKYVNALISEIRITSIDEKVDSIFFGGGTPSILKPKYISKILNEITYEENCEITLECNPGTLDFYKLNGYKSAGINRLSIGLQSANEEELKVLGRIHTFKEFLDTYEMARKTGFNNINIDIISAVPGQTFESFKKTLETVESLEPEHISAYSLIVEENTPFYEIYGDGAPLCNKIPDEDTDRDMYHFTREYLDKCGYKQYEISNYSKPGYMCRHNIKYWTGDVYYGFGVSAASYTIDKRYTNISDINDYIQILTESDLCIKTESKKENVLDKCIKTESKKENVLDKIRSEIINEDNDDKMEEFMFLGLRMNNGISLNEFKKRFNSDFKDEYGIITDKFISEGLLIYDYGNSNDGESDIRLKLTERGIDVSNYVMSEYIKKV